jgi:N-acetylmuramoyl-L-alanine amidase
MKAAIIIGHTDDDEGAVMAPPLTFLSEYKFGTMLAAKIAIELSDRGHFWDVFRRDKVGVAGAYASAKAAGAQACVELHFNASDVPMAMGTETLVGLSSESLILGDFIHKRMCAVFSRVGIFDRGIKVVKNGERGNQSVNNGTGIPSCLIEPFFGSNKEDMRAGVKRIDDLAIAIASGLIGFGDRLKANAHVN